MKDRIKLKTNFFFSLLFDCYKEVKDDENIYICNPKYGKTSYFLWNLWNKKVCIYSDNVVIQMKFTIDENCPVEEFVIFKTNQNENNWNLKVESEG